MSDFNKIGGVIVSHGALAQELKLAAETVVGNLEHIEAVTIDWNVETEVAKEQISKSIKKVSAGEGVIILTDMFGGTPTNIAAMFIADEMIEIITGANLPMAIKIAAQNRPYTLDELAREVTEKGKESIQRAGGLLASPKNSK